LAVVGRLTTGVRKIFSELLIISYPFPTVNSFCSGRMALSLRRRYFGRYQNVLRIILIDDASLVTASKEASLQRLVTTLKIHRLLKVI